MATYVPKGRLDSIAAVTDPGPPIVVGTPLSFDAGRTGLSTYRLDATGAIGLVPGQVDVIDLVGAKTLQPFEIELSWNIIISCGSGGGVSTAHVQDASDAIETFLYTQQRVQLIAYRLGYSSPTVKNQNCRLVAIETLDEIVAHWRARITARCVGAWS